VEIRKQTVKCRDQKAEGGKWSSESKGREAKARKQRTVTVKGRKTTTGNEKREAE
jgi:hypothetical protein